MRSPIAAFFAVAPLVHAFVDTSPLILYSTVDLPHSIPLKGHQTLAKAEDFLDAVKTTISACTSDAYVLISQPGLHSSDFSNTNSAPTIRRLVEAEEGRVISVENGHGTVNLDEVEAYVKSTCQAHVVTVDASTNSFNSFEEDTTPRLIKLDFPSLPASSTTRQKGLSQNDAFLSALMSMLPSPRYTVVFVSTPVDDATALFRDSAQKPMVLSEPLVVGSLKRAVPLVTRAKNGTSTEKGGLFSRYQFFTPALLTCIFIMLFLAFVVSIGARALSSITISYGSFEKEMGPSEQKKQR